MQAPVQSPQDEEHLRLLALFHRILAAILAVFSCCPGIYILLGTAIVATPPHPIHGTSGLAETFPAAVFIVIGAFGMALGWALTICVFCVAGNIDNRTRYGFCFAIAVIECLFQPLGTALGVFSLIVLTRPTVKALFH